MDVLFIDHYDSFSFNLIDWLSSGVKSLRIKRVPFDDVEALSRALKTPMPIVLSPGPKCPNSTLTSRSIAADFVGKVPVMGICLGHQILGVTLGARVVKSKGAFHGSQRKIQIFPHSEIFSEQYKNVATYNSLAIDDVDQRLSPYITMRNEWNEVEGFEIYDDGEAVIGVQFHPESFMSLGMEPLLQKWELAVESYYDSLKLQQ